jgi:hypothetical protein
VDDQNRRLNEYWRYVADRLKRWVDEKWGADYHCPMCQPGFNTWGTRGALPLRDFGQFDPDTLVPMFCAICGYTILIHSTPLGILSREDFDDPDMRRRLREAGYKLDDTTA